MFCGLALESRFGDASLGFIGLRNFAGVFPGVGEKTIHLRARDHQRRSGFEWVDDAGVDEPICPRLAAAEQGGELLRCQDETLRIG